MYFFLTVMYKTRNYTEENGKNTHAHLTSLKKIPMGQ